MTTPPEPPLSMVGRLLVSVSWEKATWYRAGGRGRENVLTLEVLQALGLLPRTAFLGSILPTRVHGAAQAVRLLTEEVEDLKLTLFPTDLFFDERSKSRPKHRWVQPDGLLERRARPTSFWVFNDPGLYYLLVKIRGWPAERYREWVAASLQHELLGDR